MKGMNRVQRGEKAKLETISGDRPRDVRGHAGYLRVYHSDGGEILVSGAALYGVPGGRDHDNSLHAVGILGSHSRSIGGSCLQLHVRSGSSSISDLYSG